MHACAARGASRARRAHRRARFTAMLYYRRSMTGPGPAVVRTECTAGSERAASARRGVAWLYFMNDRCNRHVTFTIQFVFEHTLP